MTQFFNKKKCIPIEKKKLLMHHIQYENGEWTEEPEEPPLLLWEMLGFLNIIS